MSEQTVTEPRLRVEALYAWLLNEARLDPDDLRRKLPELADVPDETIRTWAQDDGWGKKRDELYEALTSRLDRRIIEEIHRDRQEGLSMLKDLLDIAREKLASAPAKSFEGMMRSITTVVATIEALNRAMLSSIPSSAVEDSAGIGDGSGMIVLPLSEASVEAIGAAKDAYLEVRRREHIRIAKGEG